MPLNVLHYRHAGRPQWGVVRDGLITPVPGVFETTRAFLEANSIEALSRLSGQTLKEADVELLSPITKNQQFLCQGANYRQHMIESGMDPDAKTFNMIFTKAQSCIAPANTDVVRPSRVRFLDYEIELGLVLKRDVHGPEHVTEANLQEFVAGAVIVNDYSARDVQIPEMQFYKGKSFRTFGPIGPYLCLLTPDDFRRLRDLQLSLTVNGKVRQKDSVANLVFGPAETLTELSSVQDLYVGDLLSTGTPAGCALSVPVARAAADRGAAAGSGQMEDVHEDPGRPGAVSERRRRGRVPHRNARRRDRSRRATQPDRRRGLSLRVPSERTRSGLLAARKKGPSGRQSVLFGRLGEGRLEGAGLRRGVAVNLERPVHGRGEVGRGRQGVDELGRTHEGDTALPRAGPAEPRDPFAAKVLHLYQRVRRGTASRRRPAGARRRGRAPRTARPARRPGQGFRIQARARVTAVADGRLRRRIRLAVSRPRARRVFDGDARVVMREADDFATAQRRHVWIAFEQLLHPGFERGLIEEIADRPDEGLSVRRSWLSTDPSSSTPWTGVSMSMSCSSSTATPAA